MMSFFRARCPGLASFCQIVCYHTYTLWLFTVSDHKPLVYPMTATGLLNLFAGPIFDQSSSALSSRTIPLSRIPAVLFWVWFNFLVFCLGNQRRPSSISEDKLNKPWRPIPSGRICPSSVGSLWIFLQFAVLATSLQHGTTTYTVCLLALGYMYNDLGGSDSLVSRNLINAAAVVVFALGATQAGRAVQPIVLTQTAWEWQWIIGAIVFTTLQIQDLGDQEGDRQRGRRTIPLVLGDRFTRWSVTLPTLAWSAIVPNTWDLPWWGYVAPCSIGALISGRTLLLKGSSTDSKTYKMWGLWLTCLLATPAVSALQ